MTTVVTLPRSYPLLAIPKQDVDFRESSRFLEIYFLTARRRNSGSPTARVSMTDEWHPEHDAEVVLDGTGPLDEAVARLVSAVTRRA